MTVMIEDRGDRWQKLSDLAGWLEDELSEHPAKRSTATDGEAVLVALDEALAIFPQPDEPLSDFEAHAVHRFLDACRTGFGSRAGFGSPGALFRRKGAAVKAVVAALRNGRLDLDEQTGQLDLADEDNDDGIPF
jgi:hypothetical protein